MKLQWNDLSKSRMCGEIIIIVNTDHHWNRRRWNVLFFFEIFIFQEFRAIYLPHAWNKNIWIHIRMVEILFAEFGICSEFVWKITRRRIEFRRTTETTNNIHIRLYCSQWTAWLSLHINDMTISVEDVWLRLSIDNRSDSMVQWTRVKTRSHNK